MTRPATFTEADIRRVVKGAKAGGLSDFVVEVTPGKIRLLPASDLRGEIDEPDFDLVNLRP